MTARITDSNGFYEVKANPLSKVGIFEYLGSEIGAPDPNKIYKVYRPAEELSSKECVDSFKLIPWVVQHTMIGSKGVPAERKGVHGVIGEDVFFDDGYLKGNIKVFSDSMSNVIDEGVNELSLGYGCEYDFTPGNFDGKYYDAIQKNIRGNHLALVEEGRMGKEVAVLDHSTITFDSKDLVMKKEDAKPSAGMDEDMPKDKEKGMDEEMTLSELTAMMKKIMPQVSQLMEAMQGSGSSEMDGGYEESMDEEKDDEEGMDMEKEKGMDAAIAAAVKAAVAPLQTRLEAAEAKASAMDDSSVFKMINDRDELAGKVSKHIGTFDHASMTTQEVAEYGVEKMEIPCAKGQEVAALTAALHVMTGDQKLVTQDSAIESKGAVSSVFGGE